MRKSVERRVSLWIAAACVLLAAASIARAQEPPKNLIVNDSPRPVGVLRFEDGQGQARSLADFHGKMVLLNIWATWCASCRKELTTLEQLGAALEADTFATLAVSIDRGGIAAVRKLFGALGIATLPIYVDSSGQVMRSARAIGLPTSLIIDREGRELARLVGPAEWDDAATIAYFRRLAAKDGVGDGRSDRGKMAGAAKPDTRETPGETPREAPASRDQRRPS